MPPFEFRRSVIVSLWMQMMMPWWTMVGMLPIMDLDHLVSADPLGDVSGACLGRVRSCW